MTLRISVIGTGYLGAVHAACLADLGFEVVGVDVDTARVAALAAGAPPFYEPGLDDLLGRALAGGRLTFTTDFAAAAGADVHFVCVGTPQAADSDAADLSYLESAFDSLAAVITGPTLVVGKSTVPVGTAARLAARLRERSPEVGLELAWNPEFLREGFAIQDTLRPDRLVFGVESEGAERTLRTVYAEAIATGTPVVVTDFATAELVKVAANAFLATKISFINAMAEVCEASGADVTALADAIGYDARIGRRFLNAGLGFGGGCLPKDIRAFMARAAELGVDEALEFLRDVDSINLRRRAHTVETTVELLGGEVAGRTIACLGASFKPDSDDVRDSPALHVAVALGARGARVRVTDPRAVAAARRRFPDLEYADTVETAAADADAVLLLTEWAEYRALDPQALHGVVRTPRVLDARNALPADAWRAAGWTYRALGRP